MKRMMIGLATAAGLSLCASVASADPGGYAPPGGAKASGIPSLGPIGGPNTLLGAGDLPPGRGPDKYGLHPNIKRFFHIPSGGISGRAGGGYGGPGVNPLQNPANWQAGGYGMGGPAYSPNGFPPGAYGPGAPNGAFPPAGPGGPVGPYGPYGPYGQQAGPMMQGTLVFPHNTFVRSPRDYFMVDVNK